jgi:hypothetical protein
MNRPLFEPEVKAKQERAEESLRAAQLLYKAGHWDFAAARAYYAAFMLPPQPCYARAWNTRTRAV